MKNNKVYEAKIAQYAEYVNSHTEEIAQKVNEAFEEQKEFLKASVLSYIKKYYLTPLPAHKVLVNSEGQYGHVTGEDLEGCGLVSINQTLSDFLENELTGQIAAPSENIRGSSWENYADALGQDYLSDLGENLMMSVIRKELEEKFGPVSDKTLEEIDNRCDYFDQICELTIAGEFLCAEYAIDYLDISEIPLRQLVDKKTLKSFEKIDKYVAILENNQEDAIKFINDVVNENKPKLTYLLKELIYNNFLTPNYPPHFELRVDRNSRNKSGQLQKTGTISPDCTVKDFLLNEYTGYFVRLPRNKNNLQVRWLKYIEDIRVFMGEYTDSLLHFALICYFFKKHNICLERIELMQIQNNYSDFDQLVENSIFASLIIAPHEFTETGDLKLGEIVRFVRLSSPLCDTEVQKDLIKEVKRIRASRPISFAGKDRNHLGNLDMDVICELYDELENDVPGLEYLIQTLDEGDVLFNFPVLRPISEEEYDELPSEGKITRIELAEASLPVLKKYLE